MEKLPSYRTIMSSAEAWEDQLQNTLFRAFVEYQETHNLNRTQLAEHLGFSKGYISQILNGNANLSLKNLAKLSVKLGVAPILRFQDLDSWIKQNKIEVITNRDKRKQIIKEQK